MDNSTELNYQPGDHVAILPANNCDLVAKVIKRLKGVEDPDKPIQIQLLKESHSPNGKVCLCY